MDFTIGRRFLSNSTGLVTPDLPPSLPSLSTDHTLPEPGPILPVRQAYVSLTRPSSLDRPVRSNPTQLPRQAPFAPLSPSARIRLVRSWQLAPYLRDYPSPDGSPPFSSTTLARTSLPESSRIPMTDHVSPTPSPCHDYPARAMSPRPEMTSRPATVPRHPNQLDSPFRPSSLRLVDPRRPHINPIRLLTSRPCNPPQLN